MSDAGFGNNEVAIGQRRYLGSKTKLLSFIEEIISKEQAEYTSFADIFSGTGVVASHFHDRSNIIVNDILESNNFCYQGFFGKEKIRKQLLKALLNEYNSLEPEALPENYFSNNFAGTYFDHSNAKLIGHIREDIHDRYHGGAITAREQAYLITSLLYGLDRIANTVGHYDAYRKVDIPKRTLELRPLKISQQKYEAKIYRKDANQLVREIETDVVYIDPPYNSRQYSDGYHLLENIAAWKKQKVHGVAKKIDRSHLKSQYSLKSAANAFSDLINNINAKYILVSYNDMGTSGDARSQSRISDHELISALERRGKVTVYEKLFNQFTTGRSQKNDLKERIFFCRVEDKKRIKPTVSRSIHNTHRAEYVKSPLNYTGGKHKLLPQLSYFWPRHIDTFYDVFCGGANVGINVQAKKILCMDKNPKLIELLTYMQKNNFEDLNQRILDAVKQYDLSQSYVNGYESYGAQSSAGLGQYNKQGYLLLRDAYNGPKNNDKPLSLLVLILYAFNNQIRFNGREEFNLPVGKRDYNGSSRRNLANFNAITNLKNIKFVTGDFREITATKFNQDDFVYLDPPYSLGLASYNESGGWTERDEDDLYEVLEGLNSKHVQFALSNVTKHKGVTNHKLLRWAKSNGFTVNKLNHNYRNSNYQLSAKDAVTQEVLITNYEPNK